MICWITSGCSFSLPRGEAAPRRLLFGEGGNGGGGGSGDAGVAAAPPEAAPPPGFSNSSAAGRRGVGGGVLYDILTELLPTAARGNPTSSFHSGSGASGRPQTVVLPHVVCELRPDSP